MSGITFRKTDDDPEPVLLRDGAEVDPDEVIPVPARWLAWFGHSTASAAIAQVEDRRTPATGRPATIGYRTSDDGSPTLVVDGIDADPDAVIGLSTGELAQLMHHMAQEGFARGRHPAPTRTRKTVIRTPDGRIASLLEEPIL